MGKLGNIREIGDIWGHCVKLGELGEIWEIREN
jgi:hypothetical protein